LFVDHLADLNSQAQQVSNANSHAKWFPDRRGAYA
jgi:hypothetical protein